LKLKPSWQSLKTWLILSTLVDKKKLLDKSLFITKTIQRAVGSSRDLQKAARKYWNLLCKFSTSWFFLQFRVFQISWINHKTDNKCFQSVTISLDQDLSRNNPKVKVLRVSINESNRGESKMPFFLLNIYIACINTILTIITRHLHHWHNDMLSYFHFFGGSFFFIVDSTWLFNFFPYLVNSFCLWFIGVNILIIYYFFSNEIIEKFNKLLFT
jgi:hypothetical protein